MMKVPYTWRVYLDRSLRAKARIVALDSGIETQKFLSDIVRQALEKIKTEVE